jgi:hypothetical protein
VNRCRFKNPPKSPFSKGGLVIILTFAKVGLVIILTFAKVELVLAKVTCNFSHLCQSGTCNFSHLCQSGTCEEVLCRDQIRRFFGRFGFRSNSGDIVFRAFVPLRTAQALPLNDKRFATSIILKKTLKPLRPDSDAVNSLKAVIK